MGKQNKDIEIALVIAQIDARAPPVCILSASDHDFYAAHPENDASPRHRGIKMHLAAGGIKQ